MIMYRTYSKGYTFGLCNSCRPKIKTLYSMYSICVEDLNRTQVNNSIFNFIVVLLYLQSTLFKLRIFWSCIDVTFFSNFAL